MILKGNRGLAVQSIRKTYAWDIKSISPKDMDHSRSGDGPQEIQRNTDSKEVKGKQG